MTVWASQGAASSPPINTSGIGFKGEWNADVNDPQLVSSEGVAGTLYRVSVPGTTDLNGTTDWDEGDFALYTGEKWVKLEGLSQATDIPIEGIALASPNTTTVQQALEDLYSRDSGIITGGGGYVPFHLGATEPTAPQDGMIWRKIGTDDSYIRTGDDQTGRWDLLATDFQLTQDDTTTPLNLNAGAF